MGLFASANNVVLISSLKVGRLGDFAQRNAITKAREIKSYTAVILTSTVANAMRHWDLESTNQHNL